MSALPKTSPEAKAATDRFLAFYAVLTEAKQMALCMVPAQAAPEAVPEAAAVPEATPEEPPAVPKAEKTEPAAPEAAQAAPETVSVTDIFLKLRIAICPEGKPPPSLDGHPDIGYVMAAMADETMLCQMDWPGKKPWLHMLLEESLYGSRIAGERLFEIGKGIVAGDIVGRDDLAATILLALSLDFRGRWRGIRDDGKINALRRDLYEVVYDQPVPTQIDWQEIGDSALRPVLDQGKRIRLPRLAPWFAAIAAICLIYLSLSTVIWNSDTHTVLEHAESIQNYYASQATKHARAPRTASGTKATEGKK